MTGVKKNDIVNKKIDMEDDKNEIVNKAFDMNKVSQNYEIDNVNNCQMDDASSRQTDIATEFQIKIDYNEHEYTKTEDYNIDSDNNEHGDENNINNHDLNGNVTNDKHTRESMVISDAEELIDDENYSDVEDSIDYKSDDDDINETDDFGKVRQKFTGVFMSLRERSPRNGWWNSFDYDLKKTMEREPELTRSQYSLVSSGDVTAAALQLWLQLPEEIKYDPALAAFRQYYESENARKESVPMRQRKISAPAPKTKRLPAVNSAPHLNNNTAHGVSEDPQNRGVYFTPQECKVPEESNHEQLLPGQHKRTKWEKARNYTKLTLIVGFWVFFTVVFFMFNEKETIVRNFVLSPGQAKDYLLDIPNNHLQLLVDVSGPFLSEQGEQKLNSTEKGTRAQVDVWVERWVMKGGDEHAVVERENFTEAKSFILLDSDDLEFSESNPRSAKFEHHSRFNSSAVYVIRLFTDAPVAVPLSMSYQDNPIDVTLGVIYACLLLVLLYALIIFEIINRTLAAIVVSTLSLAVLSIVGQRPSVEEVISWLDEETLLLLLSMMLLVAIMAETGMFDFLAVYTFQVTKGKMWPLINLLCFITAILSTFLDNVTTVLLITPVTIKLCEVMEMHPIPVLTAMVLYSNIGGTATPVGDPPNVIIASNQIVTQSGINFANFTLHMTTGIFLVCLQTYFQLRFMYRDVSKLRPSEPREIQDLRRQLNVWKRAADSLPHMSKDELVVKERLERKVTKINSQLAVALKESNKRACPKDTFQRTLSELKEKYKIRDKGLLIKSCVAIGFVVTMFFLHAFPEFSRVSLGWTALLGAILLLILADREEIETILHRVEWSTLLFFAALFVLMEALTKLGLISYIGGLTEGLIMNVDETYRLAVALILILWVSGVTSAFVDNIPLTTMMVRVVTSLGTNPALNLPLQPLIWALSYGACLGGNGTIIGASANVVCAGVAEQHGYKITFVEFFKVGFPIMIGHLIVASGSNMERPYAPPLPPKPERFKNNMFGASQSPRLPPRTSESTHMYLYYGRPKPSHEPSRK